MALEPIKRRNPVPPHTSISSHLYKRLPILVVVLLVALSFWQTTKSGFRRKSLHHITPVPSELVSQTRRLVKGKKIIARVFFGRERTVSILEPYLLRELKTNGGILDRVEFWVNTFNDADLAFLDKLVAQHPSQLFRVNPEHIESEGKYGVMWTGMDEDTIYFKIDDDTVYIAPGALEAMVAELLRGRFPIISANIIGHPWLSLVHGRINALIPFAVVSEPESQIPEDWRVSKILSFQTGARQNLEEEVILANVSDANYSVRSLPGHATMEGTQIQKQTMTWITCIKSFIWPIISHYTFFQRLEQDSLAAFDFGIWDLSFNPDDLRYSINFLCFYGRTINAGRRAIGPFADDDERDVSVIMPMKLHHHHAAVGSAVVSHYTYFTQTLVDNSDVLPRYALLAAESFHRPDILRN